VRVERRLKEYVAEMAGAENAPLDLAVLLRPFDLAVPSLQSPTLLNGHLLDALSESFAHAPSIDLMDVLQLSCELGHEAADEMIEIAPFLVFSNLRALAE
jgi:hypothetical protein